MNPKTEYVLLQKRVFNFEGLVTFCSFFGGYKLLALRTYIHIRGPPSFCCPGELMCFAYSNVP